VQGTEVGADREVENALGPNPIWLRVFLISMEEIKPDVSAERAHWAIEAGGTVLLRIVIWSDRWQQFRSRLAPINLRG
jgi:hypothetical protein